MKKLLKLGIDRNMLKTIAIIAMVIDHIGFYFAPNMSTGLYTVFRYIGRIAMPIFVYMLVQGFFYTKNFEKYITRIAVCAGITQIAIFILMYINIKYVPSYTAAKQVYLNLNILFTFMICLLALKLIHEKVIVEKWNVKQNMILKVIMMVTLFVITLFIPLDYGTEALIFSILLYFIERFKIQMYMEKSKQKVTVKNVALNLIGDKNIKNIYLGLILLSLSMITVYFNMRWSVLFSIVPIVFYNSEKGKCNNFVKYLYYIIFPLQHVLLYSIALLITLT